MTVIQTTSISFASNSQYNSDLNFNIIESKKDYDKIEVTEEDGSISTVESFLQDDGVYTYKVTNSINSDIVSIGSNENNDKLLVSKNNELVESINLVNESEEDIQISPRGWASWGSGVTSKGHKGLWVGIAAGVLSGIIAGILGLGVASSIVVTTVTTIIADKLTDVWYKKIRYIRLYTPSGKKYATKYQIKTTTNLYRRNDYTGLIKSYTKTGPVQIAE